MRLLSEQDYKQNTPLIHKVSRACFARAQATGILLDYEDVFQHLSLVFVKAWGKFDQARGFTFSTYYVRAAYQEFNRFVEKAIAERVEHGVRSFEELSPSEGMALEEVVPCPQLTPEERAEIAERIAKLEKRLQPLTKVVLEWLLDPPEELEREHQALLAHTREITDKTGKIARARSEVGISAILAFLQMVDPTSVSRAAAKECRQELEFLLRELEAT